MKKLTVLTICCFSITAEAGFNMSKPLEVKESGRLPDGSIVFINGTTTPTLPEEEDSSDCLADIAAGTYYYVQESTGESMIVKNFSGQRISNGTKGKLVDGSLEMYGIPVYELCMNGQSPQPYVEPAETWANGECKYNTMGDAPQRYWKEINNANIQGEYAFYNASLGSSGFVGFNDDVVVYSNFGALYGYGRKVNSNSQIIYKGYKYYKGKLIYSEPNGYNYSDNYSGVVFTSPMYIYEICRTQ